MEGREREGEGRVKETSEVSYCIIREGFILGRKGGREGREGILHWMNRNIEKKKERKEEIYIGRGERLQWRVGVRYKGMK